MTIHKGELKQAFLKHKKGVLNIYDKRSSNYIKTE